MRTIVRLSPLIAMVGVIALAVGIFESGAFHKGVEDAGCQTCHIMHGSRVRDGINTTNFTPQPKLIAIEGDGCLACHGSSGSEQQGPNVYDGAPELSGGNYFNVNIDPAYGHNPSDGSEAIADDIDLGKEPPGGGGIILDNWSCNSCHDTLGGYDFRLLRREPAGNPTDLSAAGDSDESDIWNGSGNVEQHEGNHNVYRTTELDAAYGFGNWCAACHSDFNNSDVHELHPTATPVLNEKFSVYSGKHEGKHSYEYPLETTNSGARPDLEWDLVEGEEGITCLTCHKAHASENSYALRWDYYGQPEGCLQCHAPPAP